MSGVESLVGRNPLIVRPVKYGLRLFGGQLRLRRCWEVTLFDLRQFRLGNCRTRDSLPSATEVFLGHRGVVTSSSLHGFETLTGMLTGKILDLCRLGADHIGSSLQLTVD